MLYPKNIEQKLGFDQIRLLLKERCSGVMGEYFVDKMRFSTKHELVQRLCRQAEEFVKLLASGGDFPRNNYFDLSDSLNKAAVPGSYLLEEEFYDLKLALTTLAGCLAFFERDEKGEYPVLGDLARTVIFDRQILRNLEATFDERGRLRDNASPELAKLRAQLNGSEQHVRRKMDQLVKHFISQGYSKEGSAPTIRNGRLVIPVAAEHKRVVKGFVHDSSTTGQTIFVEPEELVNLNNEIRELQIRERHEVVKILTRLTDQIRPAIDNLKQANRFLGKIDFIKAKALLAQDMDAIHPASDDRPYVEWYHTFHPLLLLNYRKQQKQVVPQSVRLDEENRILLISGPNAGGKSVTLKTVGLVQYMFQCGLLVPVLETSHMGIFHDIFIDIGDQQSLDDDLSTYSSHLTNMRALLRRAAQRSLCLIDEFGSGTEPQLGAAIAEAILESLNKQGAYGVITTHYANLKFFADRTAGLFNGAMRYDIDHLKPLYQLDMGMPGSSFALEIAENIGLPKAVIAAARQKVGTKQVNIERLLAQIEQEKKALEAQNRALREKQAELEVLREKYSQLKDHLEVNRKELLAKAKAEAERLLSTANQKIENTIRAIKENQADKHITKAMRRDLDAFKEEVSQLVVEVPVNTQPANKAEPAGEAEIQILGGKIEVGDYVQIKGQEAIGEVLEISGKEAFVAIGQIRSKVKLNRLQKVSKKAFKQKTEGFSQSYRGPNLNINEKMANFSTKLDLRGKRADESLLLLQDLLDEAQLLGQRQLTIVHGKGDGVLRQVVRNFLRSTKDVRNIADEHADRGGDGVTLVELG